MHGRVVSDDAWRDVLRNLAVALLPARAGLRDIGTVILIELVQTTAVRRRAERGRRAEHRPARGASRDVSTHALLHAVTGPESDRDRYQRGQSSPHPAVARATRSDYLEDDALADLRPRSLTRIATLDQLRRTIYIGSFAKSVSAALRVGFLACNAALASDLANVKMLTHVSSSEYCERTLDAIISDGHFLRHTNHLQEKLRRATGAAINALARMNADIYKPCDQSLYLWASLPGWSDSIKLAEALIKHGVILAPGAVFSPKGEQVSAYCRFNVAYLADKRFAAALSACA